MTELGISPHTIALVLSHISARKGTVTSQVYVQIVTIRRSSKH